jgi:hypothetical protein
VTWGLWGVEGLAAFGVEIQQHVGAAAFTTLMLGLVPTFIMLASFRRATAVWQLDAFDLACATLALAGMLSWLVVNQATIALVSFTAADQLAALPTLRKAWMAPDTERPFTYLTGALNCLITLLVVHHFTTAGVLFPGCILVMNSLITVTIATRAGSKWRLRRVES